VSRLWMLAGVAALAFELIRRRIARRLASEPKLEEVSTDWLAYANSRTDEML
jgi:hypothetical protein